MFIQLLSDSVQEFLRVLQYRPPHIYEQAYIIVVHEFTSSVRERKGNTGFLGNIMMQRICSSVTSGLKTTERMVNEREGKIFIGRII